MKKFRNTAFAGLFLMSLTHVTVASAATLNVVTDSGTVLQTDALTGFTTTGTNMGGMIVTADIDGGSDAATWNNGVESASGSDFSLSLSGDSFSNPFSLIVAGGSLLTGLVLDGASGGTIFDILPNTEGTGGSAQGLPIELSSAFDSIAGTVTATFSDAVALTGDAPVGDLFATLSIDFSGLAGGGLSGGMYSFFQDTDNATPDSPLVPVDPDPSAVPLPAGTWLLLTGLVGFGALRRKSNEA